MSYQDLFNQSMEHPEQFWREQAQQIAWYDEPKQVLTKDELDLYRWFAGGKLNTCYLALDYQVEQGRGDQPALIYDSPVTQTKRVFSYNELLDRVSRFAGVLTDQGVAQGRTPS